MGEYGMYSDEKEYKILVAIGEYNTLRKVAEKLNIDERELDSITNRLKLKGKLGKKEEIGTTEISLWVTPKGRESLKIR